MGSFDSGFRMGQNAYQQSIDNDRQKVLDGYKADEVARQKVQWGREDEQRAAEDAAFANVQNVRSGISPEQQAQIQQTYGMTPQQTARTGPGLQAKLASYDAPDSYDLQNAPAAGAAPAFNAQGLKLQAPSKADRIGALEQLALARRDVGAMERLGGQRETAQGEAEDTAFALELHKNPTGPEAVQARTWINDNSKKLSAKVDPETGLTTFAMVKGDGYDEHKVLPQGMAKVGIGMKRLLRGDLAGLELIASVNKEIAANVAAEMNLDMGVGKANNSAVAQGGQMQNDNARIGIAGAQLGISARSANRQENPFSTKIKDLEGAMGRSLSEQEKLSYAGLGKEEGAMFKARVGLIAESVKSGTMTQSDGDAAVQHLYREPKRAASEMQFISLLAEARKKGDLPRALKMMQDRGVPPEKIAAFQREAGVAVPNPTTEDPSALPPPPKAAGLATPGRQITTLVPPRSGADMRPVAAATQQSPEEDFLRYMGNAPRKQ